MGRDRRKLPRGLSRNPSGSYRARVFWEDKQISLGTYMALSDAQAALAIARGQMARGTFVPPTVRREQRRQAEKEAAAQQLTVAEWAPRWIEQLELAGRSPSTLASYESTLRAHILPMLGDMRLTDITQEHIDGITAGTSPSVKRNIIRTLSALFGAAIKAKQGGVTVSPVVEGAGIMPPRKLAGDELVTIADIGRIADAMPARLAAAVWLAATCGLRIGEILGLQRCDLNLEAGEVHVRQQWLTKAKPPRYGIPKDGSDRRLAIPDVIVPILVEHVDRFVPAVETAPVFASRDDWSRPISQGAFDRAWRIAREPVKPGLHFHDLRHVALTLYARAGATQADTMLRGGHRDAKSAAIYQESDRARDRVLTERLNAELATALEVEEMTR